jgi:hypothetical protein
MKLWDGRFTIRRQGLCMFLFTLADLCFEDEGLLQMLGRAADAGRFRIFGLLASKGGMDV